MGCGNSKSKHPKRPKSNSIAPLTSSETPLSSDDAPRYKVVLVGEPNSGKSCVFTRLTKSKFSANDAYVPSQRAAIGIKSFQFPLPPTVAAAVAEKKSAKTRDRSKNKNKSKSKDKNKDDEDVSPPQTVHLQLWDTPGKAIVDVKSVTYKNADAVVVVIDASRTQPEDLERKISKYVAEVINVVAKENAATEMQQSQSVNSNGNGVENEIQIIIPQPGIRMPLIAVCLTKMDLPVFVRAETFSKRLRNILRVQKVFETSALADQGVHQSFRTLSRSLLMRDPRYVRIFATAARTPSGHFLPPSRPASTTLGPRKMFGVALSSLIFEENRHRLIPELVDVSVSFLRRYGTACSNIFVDTERERTGEVSIQDWKNRIETAGSCAVLWECNDAWIVAAILKQFLANLPDQVIPSSLHDQYLATANTDIPLDQRLFKLRELWGQLDKAPRYLVRSIMRLLNFLSSFSEKTNISSQSLGVAISPCIVRVTVSSEIASGTGLVQQLRSWHAVCEMMIRHAPFIFNSSHKDTSTPSETNPSEYEDLDFRDGESDRNTDRDAHTESLATNSEHSAD
eukprot:ANDGO_00495.mRNA.1 hypothetical protein DICPUDRAFT_50285